MNYQELIKILEEKTGKRVFGSTLADILGGSKQNMNQKVRNPNSEVTVSELVKIEAEFGVQIYRSGGYTGERQNNTAVDEKLKGFGVRLSELQGKHNFLDREMATLLKISEKDYIKLVVGKALPTIEILCRIKQNFKVLIDELLWG